MKKVKIQRESDGAFVINHLDFTVALETEDTKGFEFPGEIVESILVSVKEKYKKDSFKLVEA